VVALHAAASAAAGRAASVKTRTGDPWMPAPDYGRSLPAFTVNLLVRDVPRAVEFQKRVLGATVHAPLGRGDRRGPGAELRVFGLDPDAVERRGREFGSPVIQPATTKAHGWREMMVEDPDGYLWAVGVRA